MNEVYRFTRKICILKRGLLNTNELLIDGMCEREFLSAGGGERFLLLLFSPEIYTQEWVWWYTPLIPALPEAEAGRSLEF